MKFEKNIPFNLPVLITRGLVLFPGQSENIFAEREFSLNAINVSQTTYDSYILLVSQIDISKDQIETYEDFYHVGTLCRVTQISQIKNGFKIKVSALERVSLVNLSILNDTLYCDATIFEDIDGDAQEEEAIIKQLFKTLENFDSSIFVEQNSKDITSQFSKGISAKEISYLLSANINCKLEEKQHLLEAKDINTRLVNLIAICNGLVKNAEIERKIQAEVRDSAEKNQKEYFLREKMKAIKKELGEDDTDNDPDKIVEKVEKGNYPENIKNKVKDEMKKFDILPQGSLESSLIRTYIDLLLSLPWLS